MSQRIKIDFNNIDSSGDKLFFYEKFENDKRIEYAYIKFKDDSIYYKPEDDIEEHQYPKKFINEFMTNILVKNIEKKFQKRIDVKSKTSKPYFMYKVLGKKIPLFLFIASQLGIIGALKFNDVKFSIDDKKLSQSKNDEFKARSIQLKTETEDGKEIKKYLNIYPKDLFENYYVQGLFKHKITQMFSEEDLRKPSSMEMLIDKIHGVGFFRKLNNSIDRIIDTTTSKILKIYGYPDNLLELVGKIMPKKILNESVDDLGDVNTQRIRMSEAIAHVAYKQLGKALTTFKDRKKVLDVSLQVRPSFIIEELQGSGMMQNTRTVNPLEELLLSSKVIKTGVGNSKKNMITLDRRDLDKSYFGVIAPTTTNEYGGIGLNQTLVNKATIKDRFGSVLKKEFSNNTNSFDNLSFSESLMSFFEYDDTTRRVMGNQQFSQFVQIDEPDVPLTQTGFEGYIPFIVSDRFAIKSKKDGIVHIKNDYLIMKYDDGTEEIFSTKPIKARTKRGAYLPLTYNVLVNDGQKVKEKEILAVTNSLKHGKLAVGKNLVVAEMSYRGMNYEDGWVMTEDVGEKYKSKMYEKLTIIIPTDAIVNKINFEINSDTNPGDILIEYTSDPDKIDAFEDDESSDDISVGKEISGSIIRYRSIGGKIADIDIKINNKKIDSKILKLWEIQKAELEKKLKICDSLKKKINQLDCRDNIENLGSLQIGNHKVNGDEVDGAIIDIYIEKNNPIRNGSKFTLGATGGKGTVQYVIPKDKAPIAKETGLRIEFVPTPLSLISRKNPSILMMLYGGKLIYFMNKEVHDLINSGHFSKAEELVKNIYRELDNTDDDSIYEMVDAFFKNKPDYIKKYINKHDPLSNPAFPMLVPPFKNQIHIKDIENAVKVYERLTGKKLPLNEKVYIPEEDDTTDFEVPVGILPVYLLEHFPKEMSSARGIINTKRQRSSGQGRSGTKEGNGAISIGLYDIFSITTKQPKNLIKELWMLKSDAVNPKQKMIRQIIRNGEVSLDDIKVNDDDLIAKKLNEAYFHGALLKPGF